MFPEPSPDTSTNKVNEIKKLTSLKLRLLYCRSLLFLQLLLFLSYTEEPQD